MPQGLESTKACYWQEPKPSRGPHRTERTSDHTAPWPWSRLSGPGVLTSLQRAAPTQTQMGDPSLCRAGSFLVHILRAGRGSPRSKLGLPSRPDWQSSRAFLRGLPLWATSGQAPRGFQGSQRIKIPRSTQRCF